MTSNKEEAAWNFKLHQEETNELHLNYCLIIYIIIVSFLVLFHCKRISSDYFSSCAKGLGCREASSRRPGCVGRLVRVGLEA